MKVINFFKKVYMNIINKDVDVFSVSREKQQSYLDRFNEPKDLIERSYFQHLCQVYFIGSNVFLFQIGAFFIIPIKLIFTSHKSIFLRKNDLICRLNGVTSDIVPLELINSYDNTMFYNVKDNNILTFWDIKWFFKNIFSRYPFDFFYQLKVLNYISNYSYIVNSYRPNAIAAHCEFSSSSSAMTKYCNDLGIKHINFMHGEKLWYIRDSFFYFDLYYVWNTHYKDLLVSLKSSPQQFIVALPPKILDYLECYCTDEMEYFDFCYYLGNENKEQIDNIFASLKKLRTIGNSVKVRLHPRYGLRTYIKELATKNNIFIEPNSVDINMSIKTSKSIISLYSTVLFQGYNLGVTVILDDISDKEKFHKLKSLDYIMLNLRHKLLSEVIRLTEN